MTRYRFEVEDGGSLTTQYVELQRPPAEGDVLRVAGVTVVVNEFVPPTHVYRQSAGHGGIAVCTARSDAEQLDR